MKSSPGMSVLEQADRDVAFVAGDLELVRERHAGIGHAMPHRLIDLPAQSRDLLFQFENALLQILPLGRASSRDPSHRRPCLSSFVVFNGAERFDPSRYIAIAFKPSRQPSTYVFMISSTVAVSGMLTVFEIAPLRNGCAAAIMRRCAHVTQTSVRLCDGLNAQSKIGRCSGFNPDGIVEPSFVRHIFDRVERDRCAR